MKIALKNWVVEKSGGKSKPEKRKMQWEVSKIKGLRTWHYSVPLIVQLQLIFEQFSTERYVVKSKFTVIVITCRDYF